MKILEETPLTIPQVARKAKVNPSTAWRWTAKGVRGVTLETFSVGAKRYSTEEAYVRFIEATTQVANSGRAESLPAQTVAQRERDLQRTDRELKELGI
ncbi:DUF1580 domain-containing protein [Bythopirellula polymerisocia]|uniref:Uncharacterized protein n=1 Tax=Bythopirellula polymerisocia TaxID=2528003 RepID=A0A5C6CKL7_9BACT|nr:DUF1580 domain-containing protein [Bythopirellula polymerisocia]TWU23841.1 hypothetical protein Pla144_40180 [Bythopirellula polymerisocia]